MALKLEFNTPQQFDNRLRQRYLKSKREECARLAKRVLDYIEAGDLTDTRVRNMFGLTTGQYNTLKQKMTNMRTAYNVITAAEGE
jgi:hypothetical protein